MTTAPGSISTGGGGGGGGGISVQDKLLADIEALRVKLLTEEELELESFARRTEMLDEFLRTNPEKQAEYYDLMQRMNKEHQDKMSSIDVYRYGTGLQQTQQFMGDMAGALANGNEKMMRIGKVFAAGEALVNAWRAYSQVIADPSLPWFAKIPAALSVLSAGLGAVSAIKGVGGGGGGGAGAGAAAAGGAASGPPPNNQYYNVSLTGDGPVSQGSIRGLISQLNEAIEDGAVLKGITIQ
jgi:hypothetical protein